LFGGGNGGSLRSLLRLHFHPERRQIMLCEHEAMNEVQHIIHAVVDK